MDFTCCVFVDNFNREEDIEYVELDDIQYMFECVEQCRRISVMERITNNIKQKKLVIHTCVSYEKGFFTWLERILNDKKKSKIYIIVLRTWDLPEIFGKKCKIIKKNIEKQNVEDNNIVKKRDIDKYRDKMLQLSYVKAFTNQEEIISIMNK